MSEQVTQLTCEGIKKLATDLIEVYESRKTAPEVDPQQSEGENRFYDQRIQDLERLLYAAQPLQEGSRKGVITIGSKVTLFDSYLEEAETYMLVHPVEASPTMRYLSVDSLLGKELLLRKKGEQVSVSLYGDTIKYNILDVN
ncbi:GreA/GreB family elongation factor [Pseudalkalibacillus sp. Hm43]|uniref:GreA/GreB family elongation factor n=1 Tax=Pseudalkalibacillus sp. Hm43 TaxID=3450742 RepID=UPI003F4312B1